MHKKQICLSFFSPSTDDPTFPVCKRGDLLLVEKDKTGSPGKDWINVTNQRTSASGAVHKDTVQFLPTLEKPNDVMMVE